MQVAMVAVLDFPAVQAGVARIDSHTGRRPQRIEAVQGLSQRGGQLLEFGQITAREQVAVRQTPLNQGALE